MSGLFKNPYMPPIQIMGGIRVQTSLQGVPIPIVYGRTRIAPNLVWYGDFFWKPVNSGKKGTTGGGSGKKGGGEYDYGAAVILGLCQGPIQSIGKVWNTQGNLPTQETTETYVVGGSYTVTNEPTYLQDNGVTRGDSYTVTANDFGSPGSITLTGTQQTPMIYDGSGAPSGPGHYTRHSTNNATYQFHSGDTGKTMSITYTFSPPFTSGGIPQDPISTIPFTLFNGAQGQAVWGYLTTNHPSQAIGYTTLAYLATPTFDLGMGGVLPNLNFEVYALLPFNQAGDCNPSDVLNDIFTNALYGCGVVAGELGSWANYSSYCVANGLFISPALDSDRTAADWIKDILEATNSEIIESGGLLQIIPYGDTTIVGNGVTFTPNTQPIYDLTADDFIRDGTSPPIQITRPSVQDAFNSERVEYLDRGNSYNASIVEAQDLNAINLYKYRPAGQRSYHMFTSQTPASLCAATLLARDVYIRNRYKFKLPQSFILLDPMDLVTVPPDLLGMSSGGKTQVIDFNTGQPNLAVLLAPWASMLGSSSNLQLVNGEIEAVATSPGGMSYDEAIGADQYAECELHFCAASGAGIGIVVRNSDFFGQPSPYSGYAAEITHALGTSQTIRIVKDFGTLVASGTATPNVGDILGISAVGSTISAYLNGKLICSATDTKYTNGYPGLIMAWTATVADSQVGGFWAGPLGPTAPTVPIRLLTIDEGEDRTLECTAEEFPWGCAGPTLYPKQALLPGGPNVSAPPGNVNTPIIFEALSRMNDQIGHSIWFGLSGANPNWGGCQIFVSLDGVNYSDPPIAICVGQTQMGFLTSALASGTDPDTTHSFGVDLTESFGELISYGTVETNVFASLCYVSNVGSPGPPVAPLLRDSASGVWAIGITDAGVITTTPSSGTTGTLFLNDSGGNSWQIEVSTAGVLMQIPLSPGSHGTAFQLISTPSNNAWQITISTAGDLIQTPATASLSSTGELIAYQNATLGSAYNFTLGTLIRRGVYNSTIGAHPIGSSFMLFNDNVEGWDYDVGLIGTTVYFKFVSFNQSGFVLQNIADVQAYPYTITGASIGLLTPAHSSYRPTTNPLTAIDAGASATIDIASFLMRVPGMTDIPFGSGAVSGCAYNTLYYVYFSDPGFLPESAPTYMATTVKELAIDSGGFMFIGSILTPVSGGQDTQGRNDGGGGAQIGNLNTLNMSVAKTVTFAVPATFTNPQNAVDGSTATFGVISASGGGGGGGSLTAELSGPPGITRNYYSALLKALISIPTNTLNNGPYVCFSADYSIDGGVTFNPFATGIAGIAGTTYPITLGEAVIPPGTNLSQVLLTLTVNGSVSTTGTVDINIYEAWIEAEE